ncbi:hypothetical protein [Larsenimonas rhizosphaerae]|uniref:DUF3108 domain-containing protein n=1 Tax=Larsenimonas rhizosphaerae TaxID=2944682 RepID=A0AA41ZDS0_9GAMM|nr:hypothetical protein [Larsenimonas rhizosphaerae]MCX2522676.1 hypothetical protein [Larsenimonas rhizosphaerae]
MIRQLHLAWLLMLTTALPAHASTSSTRSPAITPFEATYHLSVKGWPDATVSHTLKAHGDDWQSHMKARISIATGEETGRFVAGAPLEAIAYRGGYHLLGISHDYRLDRQDLATLPDRQTALVQLGLSLDAARCRTNDQPPCRFDYMNEKGKARHYLYRVTSAAPVTTPAGSLAARHIHAWREGHSDSVINAALSTDTPGLILSLDYLKDDTVKARLRLTHLTSGPGTP